MKLKDNILYTLCLLLIYLLEFALEYFVLDYLLAMVTLNHYVHIVCALICLLVINPLTTYILGNMLPFRPGKIKRKQTIKLKESGL